MIGKTIGNYLIEARLGEGGMGVVYLARHPTIGRKVAVKVLQTSVANDLEVLARFFNEARAASALAHPNIVQIYDFGTLDDGTSYIVMEYLEGESLGDRLERERRLGVAVAVDIIGQAASALAAAHDKHILHRDLKPDNLFLTPDPANPREGGVLVKVLDFGIAKLGRPTSGSFKTQTGTVMGTPQYMSPEQSRGNRDLDGRSDLYALAVILYETLCGKPPFQSDGFGELIHMQISDQPPAPRSFNPLIPEWLERELLRALAKDPAARHPDMRAFRAAIAMRPEALADTPAALRAPLRPERDTELVTPMRPSPSSLSSRPPIDLPPASSIASPRPLWIAGVAGMSSIALALVLLAVGSRARREANDALRAGNVALEAALAAAKAGPPHAVAGPHRPHLSVTSDPPGALVHLDGKLIGITPIRAIEVERAAKATLVLSGTGLVEHRTDVSLESDQTLSVALRRNLR